MLDRSVAGRVISGVEINALMRAADNRCSNRNEDVRDFAQLMARFDSAANLYKMGAELLDLRERMRQINLTCSGLEL